MSLITSGMQFFIWIINIITSTTAFIYLNTVRIKEDSSLIILIITGLTLHSCLLIETHFNRMAFNALQLINAIAVEKKFLINPNIILYHVFH